MKNLLELAEFARLDSSLIGNHCRGKTGVDAAIVELMTENQLVLGMIEGDVLADGLRVQLLRENEALVFALTAYKI